MASIIVLKNKPFFLGVLALATLSSVAQNIVVQQGVQVAKVSQAFIKEVSGLAVSRSIPNTLWVHEDSGADPKFYGIDISTGMVHSTIELQGAPAVDCEDMTIAQKQGGGNCLYFGDIGDNSAKRYSGIDIIRVDEPTTIGNSSLASTDYKIKRVLYPGVPFAREQDAESLFADPLDGDLYIIQKLNPGKLFKLPIHQFDSAGVYTLDSLGSINAPLNKPTAADISPDGKYIIVRNSGNGGTTAYLFVRNIDNSETIASAMKSTPIVVALQSETQGESIAWAADGSGFYSISEGSNRPIWFYGFTSNFTSIRFDDVGLIIKSFPNPVLDILTLQISSNTGNHSVSISVTDIIGEELLQLDFETNQEVIKQLDISQFPTGTYFLRVKTDRFNSVNKLLKK